MNNNDLFQASRRRFLAQLGGLTVAGMLGPSLLTPRRATAAQAATDAVISKEGILTGSHWGAIRATVKDGRFVAAKPFELDKYPSKMIAGCNFAFFFGLIDAQFWAESVQLKSPELTANYYIVIALIERKSSRLFSSSFISR